MHELPEGQCSTCKTVAKQTRPGSVGTRFRGADDGIEAQFTGGFCDECESIIREGERITRGDDGWRHVECP